ncbi:MAG: toll/interleukin-1 receptor domain-containing protein [Pseudomonadota bacterium]
MTEDGTYDYAAFISYNSADRETARRLQRALENYQTPKELRGRAAGFGPIAERIGKVCRDRTDFKSGESLSAALKEALRKSWCLIVLCSPDSAQSKWVNSEIEFFKEIGRASRIYPLIASVDATGTVINSFPPALRRADGDEPIAADLRPAGDGWQDGVLKTLASVLDVEYDALRQRALIEARRRARIAMSIAGGMAGLSVLAAAAGVAAFQQRNRALENFEDAIVIAARSASRINELTDETKVPRAIIHRFLAETDIDLQDLSSLDAMRRHPKVKRVGVEFDLLMSDLYAEVGRSKDQLNASRNAAGLMSLIEKEAHDPVKRFANSVLFGEVNEEYLADELVGEVSQSLGAAYLSNGDLENAHAEFEKCRDLSRAVIADWELEDKEAAEFRDNALSCAAQAANVASMLNEPSHALSDLEEELDAAPANLASAPFSELVRAQIYADNGRLTDAIKILSHEISQRLDASGRQQRLELAEFLMTRSKALEMSGRLAESTADLQRAGGVLDAFLANDANDRRVIFVKSNVETAEAEMTARSGDREGAARKFAEAEILIDQLVDFDNERRDWRLARADLHLDNSDNALRQFESDPTKAYALDEAISAAKAALADIEAVMTPVDLYAGQKAVVANVALARALRMKGEMKLAGAALEAAGAALGAAAPEKGETKPRYDLLAALIADERGDLSAASGLYEAAEGYYASAISLQSAFIDKEPAATIVMRDLVWTQLAAARNLLAAGDKTAARAQVASACKLKTQAALAEYSLFVRDSKSVDALAKTLGADC